MRGSAKPVLHGPGDRVAAGDQPDVQDQAGGQRARAGFANLRYAGLDAERGHRHRQREGVEHVQRVGDVGGQHVQRIDDHEAEEAEREPRHRHLALALRAAGARVGRAGGAGEPPAEREQHRHQQHHAGHLHDRRDVRDLRADVARRADHLRDLVDRAAEEQAEAVRVEIEQAGVIRERVEEHRQRAEQHHAAHGHRALVRFRLQRRLEREHGGRAADRAAGGGQQRRVAIELHHLHADPGADRKRAHDDQHRHRQARQPDLRDFLQAHAQAEERDRDAQQLARGKVDAGRPARGHSVAQRVAVQRARDDADDQRRQAEPSDCRKLRQAGDGGGEQRDEQHAVQLAAHRRRGVVELGSRSSGHGAP